MVITDIKINTTGKYSGLPISTQRLEVECDNCKKHYYSTFKNRQKGLLKYNYDLCRGCRQVIQYSLGLRENNRKAILDYNYSELNTTWDKRFSKEKASELRELFKEKFSGENNPMYGDQSHTKGLVAYSKSCKGKTLEEIHGAELAKTMRKQMSISRSGKNNPMFGKPSPQGSGNGWSGWYKKFYFRSLLELSFLVKFCPESSAEDISIPYIDQFGHARTYHPDYRNANIIYEIKPKKLIRSKDNILKFEAAKKYCINNNLIFHLLTEDDIIRLTEEEIYNLYSTKEIKFISRYEKLFQEKYMNLQKEVALNGSNH